MAVEVKGTTLKILTTATLTAVVGILAGVALSIAVRLTRRQTSHASWLVFFLAQTARELHCGTQQGHQSHLGIGAGAKAGGQWYRSQTANGRESR